MLLEASQSHILLAGLNRGFSSSIKYGTFVFLGCSCSIVLVIPYQRDLQEVDSSKETVEPKQHSPEVCFPVDIFRSQGQKTLSSTSSSDERMCRDTVVSGRIFVATFEIRAEILSYRITKKLSQSTVEQQYSKAATTRHLICQALYSNKRAPGIRNRIFKPKSMFGQKEALNALAGGESLKFRLIWNGCQSTIVVAAHCTVAHLGIVALQASKAFTSLRRVT